MSVFTATLTDTKNDAQQAEDGTGFTYTIGGQQIECSPSGQLQARIWDGFRFPNVTIPKGVTIQAANLQLYSNGQGGSTGDDARFTIFGEAVDNSLDFFVSQTVITRALTGASLFWFQSNLGWPHYVTSPDFAPVIQEIVNRPGWASGHALALICKPVQTINADNLDLDAAEQNGVFGGNGAILTVTYNAPFWGKTRWAS